MKSIYIALIVTTILYGPGLYKFLKENVHKISKASFEEQLTAFKQLGYTFNKNMDKHDLLSVYNEDDYEAEPYSLLYLAWAEIADTKDKPISNNCWYFDYESIENEGDYVAIIKNLERISDGQLNFTNVHDSIDFDNETAWVSFDINGTHYKYDLTFDNDWADHTLFENIQELAAKHNTTGKLTVYPLGQSVIFDFMTEAELEQFKKVTKLAPEWL
ncbi:hypothetical protein ABS768_14465 [Flavobacterium sp. ST-75]|uniref:Uncharacterized protein n=1 Tax=Flavobacterium rhizophilum TaxID=3163296 RepID=A0ABW8YG98_9FLAO